jgi:hypothetical protein
MIAVSEAINCTEECCVAIKARLRDRITLQLVQNGLVGFQGPPYGSWDVSAQAEDRKLDAVLGLLTLYTYRG